MTLHYGPLYLWVRCPNPFGPKPKRVLPLTVGAVPQAIQTKAEEGALLPPSASDSLPALLLAARYLLTEAGAPINATNHFHVTALYEACYAGRAEVVEQLLKHGADPSIRANSGWTTLITAASDGHEAVVASLLRHGGVGVDVADKVSGGGLRHPRPELGIRPGSLWTVSSLTGRGRRAVAQAFSSHEASPSSPSQPLNPSGRHDGSLAGLLQGPGLDNPPALGLGCGPYPLGSTGEDASGHCQAQRTWRLLRAGSGRGVWCLGRLGTGGDVGHFSVF